MEVAIARTSDEDKYIYYMKEMDQRSLMISKIERA